MRAEKDLSIPHTMRRLLALPLQTHVALLSEERKNQQVRLADLKGIIANMESKVPGEGESQLEKNWGPGEMREEGERGSIEPGAMLGCGRSFC